jgi:uncharacterized membrane protein (UPF0182 family)
MIVKLERSPDSIPNISQVLVINQDKSVACAVPLCEELQGIFGPKYRVFAEATLDDAGTLQLVKHVPDQDW